MPKAVKILNLGELSRLRVISFLFLAHNTVVICDMTCNKALSSVLELDTRYTLLYIKSFGYTFVHEPPQKTGDDLMSICF